ncbi:hypothetical protein [Pseudomonas aeruginosa]|uniref:hypothetical protein n=1 Tax=Pseudomonas aeruginosa TaxID=287 RepID=UPI000F547451|nr:hypothetical protein [Pseudomonas aeruginosa]RQD60748.1 hypothetical protein IPC321_06940 [Pseudomonas aeruginosa]
MTDRELLELAARAAGVGYTWSEFWETMARPLNDGSGWDNRATWNPLKDDGDALRLAVKLRLDITFYNGFQEVAAEPSNGDGMNPSQEVFIEDPYAATRRAITRAATEIGKSMGGGNE